MTSPRPNLIYCGLMLAAVLGPLTALFAPLGMAPLFIVIFLIAATDMWRQRCWRRIDRTIIMIFTAVIAVCAVSVAWALDKTQTARTTLVLATEILAGLSLLAATTGLSTGQRTTLLRSLAAMLALCIAIILGKQHGPAIWNALGGTLPAQDRMMNSMSRGLTFIAILLVPTTVALWRQGLRLPAGLLWLAGAAAIVGSHSLASKLVLPTATVLAGLFWLWPRLGLSLASGLAILVVVASFPLALLIPDGQTVYDKAPWLSSSAHHRLTIWRFVAHTTLEKPLFGWALDASRSIPGGDDELIYTLQVDGQPYYAPEAQLPLHPHSAPIQVWLELGAVGAALCGILIWRIFHLLARLPRDMSALAGTTVVSGFIVACVSYGIWQSWWQGSIWLLTALIAAIATPTRPV